VTDLRTPGAWVEKIRCIVLTDPDAIGDRSWTAVVEAALRGGARAIQLRHKRASARELAELGRALRELTRAYDALLFVNDRADVALAVDADGVHLGADDVPVREIRRVAPREFLIGASADTVDAARDAEAQGADYLGVGALFGTLTKPEVRDERIGLDRLAQVARAVRIPVVGIGGVTAENAPSVLRAGAAGVAVVRAVLAAPDPEAATRALLRALG
jgi:thiamine-phosphate pyrophosphorylase